MSIREDIKAYIDGELAPSRAEEVRAAIDADPSLMEEFNFMKLLGPEIKGLAIEPTPQAAERTLAAVRRPPLNQKRWTLNILAGAVLTSLFLAVIVPGMSNRGDMADVAATPSSGAIMAKSKVMEEPGEFAPGVKVSPKGGGGGGGAGDEEGKFGLSYGVQGGNQRGITAESSNGNWQVHRDDIKGVSRNMKSQGPTAQDQSGRSIENKTAVPAVGNRKIIRTADLAMQVPDAAKAQAEATVLATRLGGFVENSNLSGTQSTAAAAQVTLRVPESRFDRARIELKKLGTVLSESVTGDDVTAAVADNQARIKVMRAEEESYVTMLRAAKKLGDVMEIKDRLSTIRQEIESLQAQLATLKDQSSLSTITASFNQPAKEQPKVVPPTPKKPDWAKSSWSSAVTALSSIGQFLGQIAIFMFVLAPIWLPALGILWWLGRKATR